MKISAPLENLNFSTHLFGSLLISTVKSSNIIIPTKSFANEYSTRTVRGQVRIHHIIHHTAYFFVQCLYFILFIPTVSTTMKSSLAIALVACASVSASHYDKYGDNDDDYEYASYVNSMNEDNGNFQYYGADDDQYDGSYSNAGGYYGEDGNFYYDEVYEYDDDGNVDDAAAAEYYQSWQNNGYYDNSGSWEYTQNYSQNEDSTGMTIRTQNCAKSLIEVTKVEILCDSPYRQRYSGTAHMSSKLCEYGDHATVMVFFKVHEDMDRMQHIYMTFGIYAGKETKELLWAVRSVELCNTFVGHECNQHGQYAFAFQVTFDYGQMSDRSLFVPMIEMGFSTRADEGYNLGGVNIYCKFNSFYQQYDPWFEGKLAHSSQLWGAGGMGRIFGKFGLLFGAFLLAVAYKLHKRSRQNQIEFQGNADELVHAEDNKTMDKPTPKRRSWWPRRSKA